MSRSWAHDAACEGFPLTLFFSSTFEEGALSLCAQCPVREECLSETLRHEAGLPLYSRHGIFGGLTPAQRVERAGDS